MLDLQSIINGLALLKGKRLSMAQILKKKMLNSVLDGHLQSKWLNEFFKLSNHILFYFTIEVG
jgi:hypothetical protein